MKEQIVGMVIGIASAIGIGSFQHFNCSYSAFPPFPMANSACFLLNIIGIFPYVIFAISLTMLFWEIIIKKENG